MSFEGTLPSMRSPPIKTPLRRGAVLLLASAVAMAGHGSAMGQPAKGARGLPVIRDAEIEQLLREYTAPILKAAGLAQQNVQITIINARPFNAFVMDGRRIFINAGALMDAKTPNEIIGVMAHETGHIAGGHLTKLRNELANAQTTMLVGMLLGAGAMVAGSRTGGQTGSGITQAGVGALTAQPELIRRSLLSYQRSQEEAADRAGVRLLSATGQSAKGMHTTFKRFAEQTMFISQSVDPYTQSHPMPRDRLEALDQLAKSSPHWAKSDSPELQLRHDLMRAKLAGFLEPADGVARRYPASDTSLAARYARAISAYRFAELRGALAQIDGLIQSQPNNPYFHELKGQALLENGKPHEAMAPLRQAAALAPSAALVRVLLGQALVAANDAKLADEAIRILHSTLTRDPDVPEGYRYLAMAFGRKGDHAQADLASAQAAFLSGEIKTARELAGRARNRFPTGSPGWVKADDIYSYKPPATATRPN
jgi:predicted Zn-dependent protease